CNDNNYEHTNIRLDNLNAKALNNFIKGFVHVNGLENFPVDADLKTKFNLADIKSFYPVKDIDLKGNLDVDIVTKGNYNSKENKFPVTNAVINLKDGYVKTASYPEPLTNIQVEAAITAVSASLKDLQVNLKPVSFEFAGNPFTVTSDLKDFNNLDYHIASKGTLDIGKLYKLFAIKGYDLNGLVRTDFVFNGTQADAVAGRYGKLSNKGTLELQNIQLVSDLFPKPFLIKSGAFHFNNDQLIADDLKLNYGSSNASLKGYFTNIINYYLTPGEVLKGQLALSSDYLAVDELMAYGGNADTTAKKADTASSAGVIMIPANLDLKLSADAAKVNYNGLNIEKCKAEVTIKDGGIALNNTGFTIIGAPVNMSATYKSKSLQKADFSYHIDAKNFDIKRAYNEVALFREMATSASSAEGIVSLDYDLSGALDGNMYPVLASLKGGGTLSVKKVKLKGHKLMNAVSKATNKDSLINPDLSDVAINSKISNNILTIERTKMKILGFRPRFEGQVSLDGKLNLKGRVGLPPFGIFGIPFSVTGTEDNPVVKLRKGKKSDELEEKDYDDDDLKDSQQAVPKTNEEKKESNKSQK
ncbi:MAG: AsmA-like C-terminal region-containing protein, partial [Bacteroidota bacterium]